MERKIRWDGNEAHECCLILPLSSGGESVIEMQAALDKSNQSNRVYPENNNQYKPLVKILWTGGWDSTFRLITLIDRKVSVQPYYLRDNRNSENNELNAIQSITRDLREASSTKFYINNVIILRSSEIEKDADITDSYNRLLKKKFMGGQYDWLARFAKNNKGLELCVHSRVYEIIKTFGDMKKINDPFKGEYFVLDSSRSSSDLVRVFGNFHFPVITFNKIAMKQEAERLGYSSIMNKTWFCYNPINNEPCGACNPCQATIEEGLVYRFSNSALKRYKIGKFKSHAKLLLMKTGLFDFAKSIFPAGK